VKVTPVNITSAAMIMQFSMVTMMFIAALIIRRGEVKVAFWKDRVDMSVHLGVIIAFCLLTVICLVFSDEYSATWHPLFGNFPIKGLSWANALFFTFIADIIWVTVLVAMSGGSAVSPFAPLYFLIPPVAIFLREPPQHLFLYVGVVCVLFTVTFFRSENGAPEVGRSRRRYAVWFVSVSSFIVAAVIGYVTRPQ